jgi:Na+/melibiose symporter-like transporter
MKTSLKLGYGVGQTSSGVKNAAFAIFLFFYFNQVLGLSGSLAGMASLLAPSLLMQLLTPWLGSCPTDTNLAGAAAIHSC